MTRLDFLSLPLNFILNVFNGINSSHDEPERCFVYHGATSACLLLFPKLIHLLPVLLHLLDCRRHPKSEQAGNLSRQVGGCAGCLPMTDLRCFPYLDVPSTQLRRCFKARLLVCVLSFSIRCWNCMLLLIGFRGGSFAFLASLLAHRSAGCAGRDNILPRDSLS